MRISINQVSKLYAFINVHRNWWLFCLLFLSFFIFFSIFHPTWKFSLSFSPRKIVFSHKEHEFVSLPMRIPTDRSRMHNTLLHQLVQWASNRTHQFHLRVESVETCFSLLNGVSRVKNLFFFGYAMESGTWLKSWLE